MYEWIKSQVTGTAQESFSLVSKESRILVFGDVIIIVEVRTSIFWLVPYQVEQRGYALYWGIKTRKRTGSIFAAAILC
jgi:hypothetical protein